MINTQKEEITPDQLMETFHGSSMKNIILFTVAVHVILLIGTSGPYLWKSLSGGDSSKLTEKERMEIATREATSSLREIASKNGIKPEELSSRFGGAVPAAPKTTTAMPPATKPDEAPPATPEAPKSAIEKEINTKEAGPKLPPVQEQDEDLFK